MSKDTLTAAMEPEMVLQDSEGTIPFGEVPDARSVLDEFVRLEHSECCKWLLR